MQHEEPNTGASVSRDKSIRRQSDPPGASLASGRRPAPCLFHLAPSTCSRCGEHTADICLNGLGGKWSFFIHSSTVGRRVTWRKVGGCGFNISCMKSTVCHRGSRFPPAPRLVPAKTVLNECLMTEQSVSVELETAN